MLPVTKDFILNQTYLVNHVILQVVSYAKLKRLVKNVSVDMYLIIILVMDYALNVTNHVNNVFLLPMIVKFVHKAMS